MDGTQPAGPVLAIDHDRFFKELLTTFFVEFLELFFPKLAEAIDRDSIEFMPQEIVFDLLDGAELVADIVVKARFQGSDAATFFIVHVEHQSTAPSAFRPRFFRYHLALLWNYGVAVYPIVIYSHDTPRKKQPNVYRMDFPDGEVLRLTYRVVQLNRLSWRRFVNSHNPVASALMAKMKVAERDRPRVKFECLRLMVTLKLDPARMRLIGAFVDAYLTLDEAEDRQFNRSLAKANMLPKEKEAVVEYVTSWERKGIEKGLIAGRQEGLQEGRQEGIQTGRQEGLQAGTDALRSVLLDVLTARFGAVDESIASRIRNIESIDELRALAHRALTVKSPGELGL